MRCPFCSSEENRVVDSRSSNDDRSIRRRRECLKCLKRFTTYEYIEATPLVIIKKDGRREAFDRKKLLSGLIKACEKRPISMETLEGVVEKIEKELDKKFEKEVRADVVGEIVMKMLMEIDQVAYVRFASVYRQFKDVSQFIEELKQLLSR